MNRSSLAVLEVPFERKRRLEAHVPVNGLGRFGLMRRDSRRPPAYWKAVIRTAPNAVMRNGIYEGLGLCSSSPAISHNGLPLVQTAASLSVMPPSCEQGYDGLATRWYAMDQCFWTMQPRTTGFPASPAVRTRKTEGVGCLVAPAVRAKAAQETGCLVPCMLVLELDFPCCQFPVLL